MSLGDFLQVSHGILRYIYTHSQWTMMQCTNTDKHEYYNRTNEIRLYLIYIKIWCMMSHGKGPSLFVSVGDAR